MKLLCILGLHSYKLVKDCGINRYYECTKCKTRKYECVTGCYQPIDRQWLSGGDWRKMTPPSTPRGRRV